MRSLITCLAILLVFAQPAVAGDADTPEIIDPCGSTSLSDDRPEADICSAWFDADVSGPAPVLSITIRTAAPSIDDARVVAAAFTDGDCRWEIMFDDAAASPEEIDIPVGEGGRIFPTFYDVGLAVLCDGAVEPCHPNAPQIPCETTRHERRFYAELPADVVTVDGTDVTFTLDMADLPLEDSEVAGEALVPGAELTDLYVQAQVAASSVVQFTSVACSGDTCYGGQLADGASGDRYVLPQPDDRS